MRRNHALRYHKHGISAGQQFLEVRNVSHQFLLYPLSVRSTRDEYESWMKMSGCDMKPPRKRDAPLVSRQARCGNRPALRNRSPIRMPATAILLVAVPKGKRSDPLTVTTMRELARSIGCLRFSQERGDNLHGKLSPKPVNPTT